MKILREVLEERLPETLFPVVIAKERG